MERTRLQVRKHGSLKDLEHPLVRFRVERHVKRRCVKATGWNCCEALSISLEVWVESNIGKDSGPIKPKVSHGPII